MNNNNNNSPGRSTDYGGNENVRSLTAGPELYLNRDFTFLYVFTTNIIHLCVPNNFHKIVEPQRSWNNSIFYFKIMI